MSLTNKNKIIYIVAIIIVVVVGLSVWFFHSSKPIVNDLKTVEIGNAVISAELATTQAEQVQGLSDRPSLAANTGMLFVFDHDSNWTIWMKDMNFPIDVLWITDDQKVSDIVEDMTPQSYPKTYASHAPTRYVLEVSAGTVKDYGIQTGQDVVFK